MLVEKVTSKTGECEVCPANGVTVTLHYGNMWFCAECWDKEVKSTHMSPENQAKRVDAYKSSVEAKVIEMSKVIDNSITVRADIFNAETIAIVDIKKAIDENPSITNKPYALAEILKERYNIHTAAFQKAQQEVFDANGRQQAIQRYLNQLANTLRKEERDKLKIDDLNYQPTPIKTPTVKKISTVGTSKKKKATKAEIRQKALELKISEYSLHLLMVGQGLSLEGAVEKFQQMVAENEKDKAIESKVVPAVELAPEVVETPIAETSPIAETIVEKEKSVTEQMTVVVDDEVIDMDEIPE